MNKKLRIGIVGYGKMGRIREQCVHKHPNLKLIGISDPLLTGKSTSKPPQMTSFEKLLSLKPDAVFACAPNTHLPKIVTFFLNHGVHVFCEKPPGCNSTDVAMMMSAERENPHAKLKFGFNHRYHQPILEAKAIVDKGRLGKLMWLRGIYGKSGGNQYEKSWRSDPAISGGGILMDQGIHMLDLFRLFCGEFDEVAAFIGKAYWKSPVEDNAFALLRNKKGQTAMLHSSATQWQHKFLLDVYLEKGYLSIAGILSSTKTYGRETLRIARCIYDQDGYPLPNPEETISYYDQDQSWTLEVDEFVNCILNDEPIKVGRSQDALKAMELVERIYRADPSWPAQKPPTKGAKNEKCYIAR